MSDEAPQGPAPLPVSCASRLELVALPGIPVVKPGDDLPTLVRHALDLAEIVLRPGDVVVVTSKLFSRSEGRFVDLATIEPTAEAVSLGAEIGKDPRVVELILRESSSVSRKAKNVLVTRHRLGFVSANAGIDASNAAPVDAPAGSGPWALLLPEDPDASARRLRERLVEATGVELGVVVTDSFGRPFRVGTVGVAIGVAGLPAVFDQRGRTDLFGRTLEATITALADQIAAAADLVAGQAAEARPVVLVRGIDFPVVESSARELLRDPSTDLYA